MLQLPFTNKVDFVCGLWFGEGFSWRYLGGMGEAFGGEQYIQKQSKPNKNFYNPIKVQVSVRGVVGFPVVVVIQGVGE